MKSNERRPIFGCRSFVFTSDQEQQLHRRGRGDAETRRGEQRHRDANVQSPANKSIFVFRVIAEFVIELQRSGREPASLDTWTVSWKGIMGFVGRLG